MVIKRNPVQVFRDACSSCHRVALPGVLQADGKGGLVAYYKCWECGNSWTCNYLKSAVPEMAVAGYCLEFEKERGVLQQQHGEKKQTKGAQKKCAES